MFAYTAYTILLFAFETQAFQKEAFRKKENVYFTSIICFLR